MQEIKFRRGRGEGQKAKVSHEKYEVKQEFPEGRAT